MKKMVALLAVIALMFVTGTALAIPLATYTHNYGNQLGQFDPGGDDYLANGYVIVSDQSTPRFYDSFDFSSLNYSSIDHFNLTLTYSHTNGLLFNNEIWFARPGGTPDQYTSFRLLETSKVAVSSSYEVNSSLIPEFNQMLAAERFFFKFAEETCFEDSFRLYSARLDIVGQAGAPVPEPSTLLLLAAGLGGLAFWRRKIRG